MGVPAGAHERHPATGAERVPAVGYLRITRNPIYLGDALVLAGAILHWDVLPALVLVPLFGGFIQRRFIRWEETRLIESFGDEARAWMGQVRRWL